MLPGSGSARSASVPHTASTTPNAVPASPRISGSHSSDTTTDARLAPIARRTPTSRRRSALRASSRLAMLAQTAASSSTSNAWSAASPCASIRCGPRGVRQNGTTSPLIP